MDETLHTENEQPSENIIPAAKKAYSRSLLNLALYEIIAYVVIIIAVSVFHIPTSGVWLYIINFIPMYAIAFPCYLLLSKPLEKTTPEQNKMKPVHFLLAFPCCQCLAIIGNMIGVIVNLLLTLLIGTRTTSTFLTEGVFGENAILFMSIAVLIAPIIEEMLFRKILIDRIRKYGDLTAILISGIMFGLFHGNFTQVFYAAALGLFFAYIYVKTGKILHTIILHIMVNFWGTVMPAILTQNANMQAILEKFQKIIDNPAELLANTTDLSILDGLGPLIVYATFNYALAIAGFVLLLLNRKKFKLNPPLAPIPKDKRFATVCLNFGFLLFVGVCIFKFINQIVGLI